MRIPTVQRETALMLGAGFAAGLVVAALAFFAGHAQ